MSAFLAVGAVANVALLILVVGIVLAKRRGARRVRSAVGAGAQSERAAQRRYLVENWSTIERISASNGMSAAELEAVKRRLFELETPS